MTTYVYDRKIGAVVPKREPQSQHLIEPLVANSFGGEMQLLLEDLQFQMAEMFSNGGQRINRRTIERRFT